MISSLRLIFFLPPPPPPPPPPPFLAAFFSSFLASAAATPAAVRRSFSFLHASRGSKADAGASRLSTTGMRLITFRTRLWRLRTLHSKSWGCFIQ
jgi:hypothetical protein